MLEAFWAVIVDLFYFVFPAKSTFKEVSDKTPSLLVAQPALPTEPAAHSLLAGDTAYVVSSTAACYARPILAFDTKVGMFLYGEELTVTMKEGKFSYVRSSALAGWVATTDISYSKHDIFARLESGVVYPADSFETIKIRRFLKDECDGGALFLPLQPTEFVLYELAIRRRVLKWPTERPRLPGSWQVLLKGRPQCRIGIEPKTGSVMEYYKDTKTGVLAFVEAVHPEQSIVVRSVGVRQEGEYLVETLPLSTWRELRPVFISFT